MATTSTYLNFERSTEAAFTFYKNVFSAEFIGGIMRHGDVPVPEGQSGPTAEDQDLIINVALPILGGHVLMGTDIPESMGFKLERGNNLSICIHPDTRAEADTLFAALSDGGHVKERMQVMFWGDYFGTLIDKFGIHWMINCGSSK